ncbi:hypothetical protein FRC09_012081, partial [Ceratobasidium sp. 395]
MADITSLVARSVPEHRPPNRISKYLNRDKTAVLMELIEDDSYWVEELYKIAIAKEEDRRELRRGKWRKNREQERSGGEIFDLPSKDELGFARYALVYSSIPRLDSAEYKWPKSLIATETRGCHGNQSDLSADICKECLDDLQQPTALPPKHSLANNTWVGEVPWQLERLTFAEHLLIARIYPRMFLIKLFPREKSQRNLPRDQVQTGLRGNVVSFELNSAAIADMLSGNLMPQKPDILASTLSVTFVGCGQIRDPSTLNMLRIRRDAKYYGDIVIDQDRLNALPPDGGVPDAIKAGIQHETNELMVNDEYRGYVPETYYSDNVDIEGVSHAEGNPEEDLDDGPDVIPLQCLGVMDNDLSQVSPDEFMQWGLHNMQRHAEGSHA